MRSPFQFIKDEIAARRVAKPPEHPLVQAAQKFVDVAVVRDDYCEKAIYPAATKDKVAFIRLTHSGNFDRLEAFLALARKEFAQNQKLSIKTLDEIANSAEFYGKIGKTVSGKAYTSAIDNYISLGHNYKGPDIALPLADFVNAANTYKASVDMAQRASRPEAPPARPAPAHDITPSVPR